MQNKKIKNRLSTQGYFIKRLKDCGYIVWRIFDKYSIADNRKWTLLINPGEESVFITCRVNVGERASTPHFDIYDSRQHVKMRTIVTDSMEVLVNNLVRENVTPDSVEFKKDASEKKTD
jgi:hypothetical protein